MASDPSPPPKQDHLLDLIQRFIAHLSNSLAFDVDRKKLHSITSLAALAITLVIAWKLLRVPEDQQRRRRRPAPSPGFSNNNLHPNVVVPSSETHSSANSRAQYAVNDFFQSENLTLEQIVRRKLFEGRKFTCQLLGIILEETTPEELQKSVTVKPSVLEVILEIAKSCDVYLMERILDDESVDRVLSALEESGIFKAGGLIREKVLFCSTENGRTSFVRQLEPDWHVDTNPEIIHQLARFIKYLLYVAPEQKENVASNVFKSASLEQFFGGHDRR